MGSLEGGGGGGAVPVVVAEGEGEEGVGEEARGGVVVASSAMAWPVCGEEGGRVRWGKGWGMTAA